MKRNMLVPGSEIEQFLKDIETISHNTLDPTQAMSRRNRNNYDPTMNRNNFDTGNVQANVQTGTGNQIVSTNSDAVQFNVNIVSSLATDLTIELFQYDASQTRQYDANNPVNNYYPVSCGFTLAEPITATEADTYFYGQLMGNLTKYTNAGGAVTGNTPNTVYFDQIGNLVYQPGYVAGVLPAGNVTISCLQVPYQQLFQNAGKYPFIIQQWNIQYDAGNSTQIPVPLYQVKKSFLGASSKDLISPQAYKTNTQYDPSLIEMPLGAKVTPEIGFQYAIKAGKTVQFNMFLARYAKGNI